MKIGRMEIVFVLIALLFLVEGMAYAVLGHLGVGNYGFWTGAALAMISLPLLALLYVISKVFTEKHAQKDERLIAITGHATRHAFAATVFVLVQLMLFEVMTDITIGMRISFLSVGFGFIVFLISYFAQRYLR
jgi:hypothetical protein